MSVTRLLLSGLLVASGLILGAFTLHGYFDPQWPQRQMQAAGTRSPALKPWSTRTVQTGERAVLPVAARPKPSAAEAKAAAAARARKRRAAKERAEKRLVAARKAEKAEQQSQQATLQWPWNWLTN